MNECGTCDVALMQYEMNAVFMPSGLCGPVGPMLTVGHKGHDVQNQADHRQRCS